MPTYYSPTLQYTQISTFGGVPAFVWSTTWLESRRRYAIQKYFSNMMHVFPEHTRTGLNILPEQNLPPTANRWYIFGMKLGSFWKTTAYLIIDGASRKISGLSESRSWGIFFLYLRAFSAVFWCIGTILTSRYVLYFEYMTPDTHRKRKDLEYQTLLTYGLLCINNYGPWGFQGVAMQHLWNS